MPQTTITDLPNELLLPILWGAATQDGFESYAMPEERFRLDLTSLASLRLVNRAFAKSTRPILREYLLHQVTYDVSSKKSLKALEEMGADREMAANMKHLRLMCGHEPFWLSHFSGNKNEVTGKRVLVRKRDMLSPAAAQELQRACADDSKCFSTALDADEDAAVLQLRGKGSGAIHMLGDILKKFPSLQGVTFDSHLFDERKACSEQSFFRENGRYKYFVQHLTRNEERLRRDLNGDHDLSTQGILPHAHRPSTEERFAPWTALNILLSTLNVTGLQLKYLDVPAPIVSTNMFCNYSTVELSAPIYAKLEMLRVRHVWTPKTPLEDSVVHITANSFPALKHLELYPHSANAASDSNLPLYMSYPDPIRFVPPPLTRLKLDDSQWKLHRRCLGSITKLLPTLKELSLTNYGPIQFCPQFVLLLSNILNYGSLDKFEMQIVWKFLQWDARGIRPNGRKALGPQKQALLDLAAYNQVPLTIPTIEDVEEGLAKTVILTTYDGVCWPSQLRGSLENYLVELMNVKPRHHFISLDDDDDEEWL